MSAQPHNGPGSRFGVNTPLTSKPATRRTSRRPAKAVENDDYTRFCARIIRAAGVRIGEGDVEGLGDLLKLQRELDQAAAVAVAGLRQFGYSWGDIALRLGITRQAAQQRWGGSDQS